MTSLSWPVATERLLIRRVRPDDEAFEYALRSHREVRRWLTRGLDTVETFRDYFATPEFCERTLIVEHEGRPVGDLYLHVRDGWAQREVAPRAERQEAEIGWVLHPDFHHRGLAGEAARALIERCFGSLEVRRVVALAFAENRASTALMERLGMRREGYYVGDSLHAELGWVDSVSYALLASEWSRSTR